MNNTLTEINTSLKILLVTTFFVSLTMGFMIAPKTVMNKFAFFAMGGNNQNPSHRSSTIINPKLSSNLSRAGDAGAGCHDDKEKMPKLPANVVKYSQVPKKGKLFTATTIPKGLLKQHTTKRGTWGIINVSKGKLEYLITAPASAPASASSSVDQQGENITFELSPEFHGIIEPQKLHQVKPLTEDVEFVVEFLRVPGTGPVSEKREGL